MNWNLFFKTVIQTPFGAGNFCGLFNRKLVRLVNISGWSLPLTHFVYPLVKMIWKFTPHFLSNHISLEKSIYTYCAPELFCHRGAVTQPDYGSFHRKFFFKRLGDVVWNFWRARCSHNTHSSKQFSYPGISAAICRFLNRSSCNYFGKFFFTCFSKPISSGIKAE